MSIGDDTNGEERTGIASAPWSYYSGTVKGADGSVVFLQSRSMVMEFVGSTDEWRLIMAAPELLAALQMMVRMADGGKRPLAARKKAKTAIAKALGKK